MSRFWERVRARLLICCRRLDVEDAKKLNIPHIVLASNGEDKKVVDQYHEVLVGEGKPGVVEYYGTMHHGWSEYLFSLAQEFNYHQIIIVKCANVMQWEQEPSCTRART